jgi:trk system potassium uptake protein TrkA
MKVIIVGGGQVGSYLASLLIANGHEIKIIEYRDKNYKKLKQEFSSELIIFGYGSDPAVLEEAGIYTADVLAAVTAEDDINLVVTTLAKMEFGVERVIGRVNNPKNAWLYNSNMGVDVAVNQADLIAHLVMEEMDLNNMFTLMKLNRGEYDIVQTKVVDHSKARNQYVKDLPIPKKSVLISIIRNETVLIPKGDTQILEDDEVLILTDVESKELINELFG